MQIIRPKFLASSCVLAAWLSSGPAVAAEPTTAEPAKAEAAGSKPAAAPAPAQPAGAQPSQTPQPAAPAAAPAAPPSPEVLMEAKQRFDRGFELYEEGEYPLALIEF
ncbi:MAG TPA: hypothetical protein VMG12_35055, partial [Polyangiaceae bacterium]|nr:hypothetical protein [Polyangiaceae bacterium]